MKMRLRVLVFCMSMGLAAPGVSEEKKAPPKLTVAYRFTSAFGQKGGGVGHFHEPSAIAIDSFGNLYVADTGNDRVQKFDTDGTYVSEVGTFGWDPGQFSQPAGVAVGKGGLEVCVADGRNNRIQIFSPHFRLLGVVGGRDVDGPIRLGTLGGIAVSEDGELYVSDTDADQVVQISDYSPVENQFGGYGYGAGRLRRPLGLAVGQKNEVYVCDSENDRVAVFDRYGEFRKSLVEGSLSEPAGVCTGPEDVLFVADSGHHRIVVLDLRTGEAASLIGGPDAGQRPGAFRAPRDVAFSAGKFLFVLDAGNHRVQKFEMLITRR
ncbi:MAG: NHL repeat-containing protein [Gemmatimonadota bacterium]|nr:NHL repeat-containing protein [Gemmatimonadota bacterium]